MLSFRQRRRGLAYHLRVRLDPGGKLAGTAGRGGWQGLQGRRVGRPRRGEKRETIKVLPVTFVLWRCRGTHSPRGVFYAVEYIGQTYFGWSSDLQH